MNLLRSTSPSGLYMRAAQQKMVSLVRQVDEVSTAFTGNSRASEKRRFEDLAVRMETLAPIDTVCCAVSRSPPLSCSTTASSSISSPSSSAPRRCRVGPRCPTTFSATRIWPSRRRTRSGSTRATSTSCTSSSRLPRTSFSATSPSTPTPTTGTL